MGLLAIFGLPQQQFASSWQGRKSSPQHDHPVFGTIPSEGIDELVTRCPVVPRTTGDTGEPPTSASPTNVPTSSSNGLDQSDAEVSFSPKGFPSQHLRCLLA